MIKFNKKIISTTPANNNFPNKVRKIILKKDVFRVRRRLLPKVRAIFEQIKLPCS